MGEVIEAAFLGNTKTDHQFLNFCEKFEVRVFQLNNLMN